MKGDWIMFDFDNPNIMNTINSAERYGEVSKAYEAQRKRETQKDAAIFQMAEESKKQNKFLLEQVDELKEQNKLLKEMYDNAKAESMENQKQAKQNKVFGWVSFAIGTFIGIVGVVLGIIF